ncbi:hypothetical protein AVEN_53184-1 [Araneus ventricosus]|uniref:Uncharacterized protein n=1 Tax=Araneus ventricosus TaxID=182803 RepID=A0A4Y2A9P0_ARAVE|nr:hypothetical protein AVEN_53184-1 [Araneus ventricosus]
MTRTALELAHPSPNFHTTGAGGRLIHVRFNVHQARKHGVSSGLESGFQLEVRWLRSRELPLGHRSLLTSFNTRFTDISYTTYILYSKWVKISRPLNLV